MMRPHTPSAPPTPEPSRNRRERKRGLGATQFGGGTDPEEHVYTWNGRGDPEEHVHTQNVGQSLRGMRTHNGGRP